MLKNNVHIFLLLFLLSAFNPVYEQNVSDTTSVDFLISKGEGAQDDKDYEKSNYYYEKILEKNENDYDAKYAIALNYYNLKKYNNSLDLYLSLYSETPLNTDVINRITKCYIKMELYDKSMEYINKSISIDNNDVSVYFDMASLYILKDKTDSAKYAYNEILRIDSTYAEAYAGVGKMYYWQNKPSTALKYYKKALQLDSENAEIIDYYKQIKNELSFSVSLSHTNNTEEEESYTIDAVMQKYGLEKRINDYVAVSFFTLWDYSNRNNLYYDDIKRWYDNTWLKTSFMYNSHKLNLFTGASGNDSKITSYGFTWSEDFNIYKIKIRNYLTYAYDYFYYWNMIGESYFQNNLIFLYKKISLGGTYKYAVIKDNYVWEFEEKTDNPHYNYNIELKYELFKIPKITIGLNQSNSVYKYISPLYFSPENRTVRSVSVSNFYKYRKLYTYAEFQYGQDNNETEQTSGSLELGYERGTMSFSVNCGFFDNPYYKNKNLSLLLKKNF